MFDNNIDVLVQKIKGLPFNTKTTSISFNGKVWVKWHWDSAQPKDYKILTLPDVGNFGSDIFGFFRSLKVWTVMGCDAAASALTVLFSFPFSHNHSLTVLQLSRIHFHFSPLLSLKWYCLLAIFLAASLLFSIYGCCSPSLFISPLTLAAVQNSLSLFTFACSLCFFVFCLTL